MQNTNASQIAVFLGISLDGFIAGEGGDLSWLSDAASASPEETGYDALMARTDALVLGRNTYDSVRGFTEWPFGNKPVYVLTNRPLVPAFGERVLQGDIERVLQAAQSSSGGTIYLDGGDVVRQAMRKNLVDELTLSWVPVVLGSGIRLFEGGLPRSRWKLTGTRLLESGMVQASYRRAP
jgi:dihydrofolate reductase